MGLKTLHTASRLANPSDVALNELGLAINVVRDFNASGSNQSTTGSISAGSNILTLASAIDFKNGQGISIAHAGPLPPASLPDPAAPSLSQASGNSSFTTNEVVYVGITYTDMAGNQTLAAVSSITISAAGNVITLSEAIPFGGTGLGVYVGTTSTPLLLGTVTLAGGITYSGGATSGLAVSVSGATIMVTISAPATSTGASEPTSNTTSTTPTAPTVTAEGTTGSTSWAYAIALLDGKGGITAASPATTITNGNATLSGSAYNSITFPIVNTAGVAIYRTTAGGTPNTTGLIAVVKNACQDTGLALYNPNWVPTNPPAAAVGDALITTIMAGAGTTSLQLAEAATTTVSGQQVMHDDTAAIQAAINAVQGSASGRVVYLASGYYRISSTLQITGDGVVLYADPMIDINGPTKLFPTMLCFDVLNISAYYGCWVENLHISGNIAPNEAAGIGGRAIVLSDTQNITLKNVSLFGVYNGVYITGGDITLNNVSIGAADIPEAYNGRYGFYVTGVSGNPNFTQAINCNVSQIGSTTPRTMDAWVLADGYNTLILINCGANQCNQALWSTSAGGNPPNFLQTYNFTSDHCNTGVQLDTGNYALFDGLLVTSSYVSNVNISTTYQGGPIQISNANITNSNGDGIVIQGGTRVLITSLYIHFLSGNGITVNGTPSFPWGVLIGDCSVGDFYPPSGTYWSALNFVACSNQITVSGCQLNNVSYFLTIGDNFAGTVDVVGGSWLWFGSGLFNIGTGVNPANVRIANIRGVTPFGSISPPASPLVSGTIYQNTQPVTVTIYQPAYATTSGTAGTVAVALGSNSTPSTIFTKQIPGTTSSSAPDMVEVRVPSGWYYSFTASGATLATATIIGE